MRKQVEASMLVTGELVVAPDGTVKSYTLDRADKLPPEVRELLAKVVPGWELGVAKSRRESVAVTCDAEDERAVAGATCRGCR